MPLVYESFRLHTERESAGNLDRIVSKIVKNVTNKTTAGGTDPEEELPMSPRSLAFVSDSLNVMVLTRAFTTGKNEAGSRCCAFAYGCSCHALHNSVKDLCKIVYVRDVLKKSCEVVQLFKNVHLASDLISIARTEVPPDIRPKGLACWGGVNNTIGSCGENKSLVVKVLTEHRMLPKGESKLDFGKKTKPTVVTNFALDGAY